jgi:hypothetical protein
MKLKGIDEDQGDYKDHNFFNGFGLRVLAGAEAVEDEGKLKEESKVRLGTV